MSTIKVDISQKNLPAKVALPASKSLWNRALVLQANYPVIGLEEVASPDDVQILKQALLSESGTVNIGHAGTAMRFATAFFAAKPGADILLTGSDRMKLRPIAALVNALKMLGANIEYLETEGYPPLRIKGQKMNGGVVEVDASISSQFISALMLAGPTFAEGLHITFLGNTVSWPYIKMTANLMEYLGFSVDLLEQEVKIFPQEKVEPKTFAPETDWSSAAFWYGLVAQKPESSVFLEGLQKDSFQGDARVATLFQPLGVKTSFLPDGVLLENKPLHHHAHMVINLQNNPDLAQPLAFTCAALGLGADLRGLQTLKWKETNRLMALQNELQNVGVKAAITESSLCFEGTTLCSPKRPFQTYQDHRMAMSAALLGCQFPVEIEHPEVVSKSYPDFWKHLLG